ncbi:hypothetical protein T265_06059 [Opisthorchis viverrini]|uniref:Uncharacterized protein n=1 Tax=Opisthorchis viverrini TaxID=6198 RepID=A0A074ZHN5_OPIVI|nr:hypothetical protein T265_06059 [Opisthorchis viverrini]KER26778.1 hypothetical protein T265_06059 [Opisthorchis viverrini]
MNQPIKCMKPTPQSKKETAESQQNNHTQNYPIECTQRTNQTQEIETTSDSQETNQTTRRPFPELPDTIEKLYDHGQKRRNSACTDDVTSIGDETFAIQLPSSATNNQLTFNCRSIQGRRRSSIIIDSMTSVFNTDASLPYNHDLFESLIVKKRLVAKFPVHTDLAFTRDSIESLVYDVLRLCVVHTGRLKFQLPRYSTYRSIFS